MDVESPSNLNSLLPVQYIEDDSPLYDSYGVNGAVVPFSWEKKPGVPLVFMNPIYLDHNIIKEKEASDLISHPNYEEKSQKPPLLHQRSLQISPHQLLLPLPKPPAALQVSSTHNSSSADVSNICSPLTPSPLSYSSPKTHTHKLKRVPFHTHLNNKQAKNTVLSMHRANIIADDPFLRAIQACTEPASMKEADQEKRVQEIPTKEAKEGGGRIYGSINNHSMSNIGVQKMSSKASFSNLFDGRRSPLRKKFDGKVVNARSPLRKNFDDKELDKLSKNNGAFDDKVVSTKAQESKLNNGDFDGKLLSTKAVLSKANGGDFDDKVPSTKAQLSKANGGDFDGKVPSTKAQLSKVNDEAIDDNVPNSKAQLSKVKYGAIDDNVLSIKAQLGKANYGAIDDKVPCTETQLSKVNYVAIDDKVLDPYKSPIRMCNEVLDDKGFSIKVPIIIRKLIVEREGSGKQEGHPPSMGGRFHQSSKNKKPIAHKREQARPHHQRSSSYGCMGCSNVDYNDSIIRL